MTLPASKSLAPNYSCSHCGESCNDDSLITPNLSFCCQGCKMVYDILHTHQMDTYYTLENQPGISLKDFKTQQYSFLNNEAIKEKFIDYTDGKITKVSFHLPQIHCSSCIWLLENLNILTEGILSVRVHFLKKTLFITYQEEHLLLSDLADLLQKIGYQPHINLGNLEEDKDVEVNHVLLYKLGLTGFIFGNIMLLSFPEYLGLDKTIHPQFHFLFGYLNLLLSLPLLFYSGVEYLKNAYLGLYQRRANIDIPISIGILTLFGRSVVEIIGQSGSGYLDSLAGLIFFLLIGKWFQQKTYHQISFDRDYKSYFPIAANVLTDGVEKSVALSQLKVGDQVLIRSEELIPADGIVQSDDALIDYSFVTGESVPVAVGAGQVIYAGGRQIGGAIQLTLTKAVNQSYLVQLWEDEAFQSHPLDNTSSQMADVIGKYFTYGILLIAGITLLYWIPINLRTAINAFSAVLIIACPCAIALSIPFTYGNVLRRLAQRGGYLKNTNVIEKLQQVDQIVFDKTGTLTQRGESLSFDGHLSEKEKVLAKSLAYQSNHPRSQQIVKMFLDSDILPVEDFKEVRGEGIYGKILGDDVSITKFRNNSNQGQVGFTQLSINGERKGCFIHQSQLRSGLTKMFGWLKKFYRLNLLSGDHNHQEVCLKDLFPQSDQMHFNQSPQDKLDYIKQLQEAGKVVVMIGDGLNDAGALRQADVGLVVSENNNNFTPACDGVLSVNAFLQFPALLKVINLSKKIIYGSYFLALCYNIVGLSFAVKGQLSPVIAAILMPLSSVTIVIFGVGLSTLLVKKVLS